MGSFALLLVYLFCTFIRPQDWVIFLYAKPVIDVIAGSMIFCLLFERFGSRKVGLAMVSQNVLMIGFFGCILMSHVAHSYLGGLQFAFSDFLPNFVLFYLLLNTINTPLKFKTAIWVTVLLILALVFQGIYQDQLGYGWAGQEATFGHGITVGRINWVGIFNDPNDLSLTFVVAFGLLFPFIFAKTRFMMKLVNIVICGYLVYGMHLTNSRGGLLALMATVGFYFLKKSKYFYIGAPVGGILAYLILIFGPSRASLISVTEASAHSRLELWYEGMWMLRMNPIFGVGYNLYTNNLPLTAHNSYILVAAELGFIGYFFWVALLYSSYSALSVIQIKSEKYKPYALGLQASLIGFCAAAMFLSRTYNIIPYMLFAFTGALMCIVRREDPSIEFKFGIEECVKTVGISIAILIVIYSMIKLGL